MLRANEKISGGIFLYRQQMEYIVRELILMARPLHGTATVRVCETGFNAGHASSLMLSASPRVKVVAFDTLARPFQTRAVAFMKKQEGYHRRLKVVQGVRVCARRTPFPPPPVTLSHHATLLPLPPHANPVSTNPRTRIRPFRGLLARRTAATKCAVTSRTRRSPGVSSRTW